MLPLRVDAPEPIAPSSTSTTEAPLRAVCSAVDSPVRPPPTTTMSADSGRGLPERSGNAGAVSSQ